ncbi:MAG: NADH-quinone oxidoreductase subunit N [Bryobacterales bacterium]|nr:NADH-quinone oxidoreductase subunit N [Bryobacterales bacterium]MDE0264965.1 NADH-quinone oxidoreductase subunit N [Bryobacterales bacterium]MDE0621342.1 NADH-quinone oxidoreductase subunit N [Bryobacterales bacterium]
MMDAISFTLSDFHVLKPAIVLCLFGCGILLTDAFLVRRIGQRWLNAVTALVGEAVVAAVLLQYLPDVRSAGSLTGLGGSIVVDGFGVFFNIIFMLAAALAVILSARYMEAEGEQRGEYYALILFAQAGMSIMATGHDLVVLFVALETMALSFYVMVGFLRDSKRSNEAAMKYLILGAFSSGLLAYGFSVLYGISGSTSLAAIGEAIADRPALDWIMILALITTSVGLFFKIAAAPFHMWAPDVYEGAPTPTTAYVSVASKAASFALMIRLFVTAYGSVAEAWVPLLAIVAVATMTIGNLAAVTQSNLKRLLAYSSVAHAGYMLLGLVAFSATGLRGIAIYLLAYVFMNFGAFALIAALRRDGEAAEELDDLNGLFGRAPGYTILMAIFMLSLTGIPPLAGFYGKYYIFLALLGEGYYILAVFAALYVAVSAYYYFRVIRACWLGEAAERPASLDMNLGTRTALVASGVLTVLIGILPQRFIDLAGESVLAALR